MTAGQTEQRPTANWAVVRRFSAYVKLTMAGLVFGAGVLFLVVGVRELADSASFVRETVAVAATVESVEEQAIPGVTAFDAVLSYAAAGTTYRTLVRYPSRNQAPPVGGTVSLRYHLSNPATAVEISSSELWFAGSFFTLFSLVWMGLVAFGVHREWRDRGSPAG